MDNMKFVVSDLELANGSISQTLLSIFSPTEKGKKRYRDSTPLSAFFSSMFNVRLVLLLVLLVHVQADSRNNNYIRGEKVNPASRIVNGKNHEAPDRNASNDILEFQTVTRLPGSQPAQDGPRIKRAQWF